MRYIPNLLRLGKNTTMMRLGQNISMLRLDNLVVTGEIPDTEMVEEKLGIPANEMVENEPDNKWVSNATGTHIFNL
jgi:hypothetical protein